MQQVCTHSGDGDVEMLYNRQCSSAPPHVNFCLSIYYIGSINPLLVSLLPALLISFSSSLLPVVKVHFQYY